MRIIFRAGQRILPVFGLYQYLIMTKDDKVFGAIFLFSRLHKKKLLSLGKSYLICEESADVFKVYQIYMSR